MICPLRMIGNSSTKDIKDTPEEYECIREQCAWWSPWNCACAILTIAAEINIGD